MFSRMYSILCLLIRDGWIFSLSLSEAAKLQSCKAISVVRDINIILNLSNNGRTFRSTCTCYICQPNYYRISLRNSDLLYPILR